MASCAGTGRADRRDPRGVRFFEGRDFRVEVGAGRALDHECFTACGAGAIVAGAGVGKDVPREPQRCAGVLAHLRRGTLVLAHHTSLAYMAGVPAATTASLLVQPRWWKGFPILDSQRSAVFAIFPGF